MGVFVGFSRSRRVLELLVAAVLALGAGLAVVLIGGIALKYQIAAVVGAVVAGAVLLGKDRRIVLVVLWILVMPLSLEKVFASSLNFGTEFSPQFIVINAGDVLLLMLAAVLLLEWLRTRVRTIAWSSFATAWLLILLWSFVSYSVHAFYLRDGLVNVAPLTLLTYARLLIFFVLLHSAIRSRAEMLTVLLAVGCAVLLQSLLVMLAYATGEIFNLARLTGGANVGLNTFGGSGAELITRATGTVGHANQQAIFQLAATTPLIALLAVRNPLFRWFALLVIAASSIAILLTFSRGAWISCAITAVVILFMAIRRRMVTPSAWLAGALAAMAGVIVLAFLSGPILQRLSRGGDDGATESRLRMFVLAFDLFQGNPLFGVGPGEYTEAGYKLEPTEFRTPEWVPLGSRPMVPPVGRLEVGRGLHPDGYFVIVPLPVHNRYLLSLSELGVIGLVLWLALIGVSLRAARRCVKAKDPVYRLLGISCFAAILALLFYMNVDLFADDKSLQILFLVPLMAVIAASHVRSPLPTAILSPLTSTRDHSSHGFRYGSAI